MGNPDYSNDIAFTYELHRNMVKDNLSYVYRGDFSETLTERILTLAENNLGKIEGSARIRKKVYFIMVESLQNITRHWERCMAETADNSGFFIIQRIGSDYFISSGNMIENKNVGPLRSKLEKVNSLDPEGLKNYSIELLSAGSFSDKGGAGLGLVEIARKSGNKLAFDFRNVDDNYSYFYLQTRVPTEEEENQSIHSEGNLEATKNFHNLLQHKKLNMIYHGEFSSETVDNVLSMLEWNIGGSQEIEAKRKNQEIIVELLENICHHGVAGDDPECKPGIFIIGREENQYQITAGNIVENSRIIMLEKNLHEANQGKPGSGLAKIRKKSGKNLVFGFVPVNETHSFFSLRVCVN